MIGYISGKVKFLGNNYAVIEAGGVGYKIFVFSNFKMIENEEAEFFIHHHVKEDASNLYGFSSKDDLDIFERLLEVSGVGPKAALGIVGSLGREKIVSAIKESDQNLFKSISGIGAKVAAKIIVELKNKIDKTEVDLSTFHNDETVDALLALGLKKNEILPALKSIPSDLKDIQSRIKFVLKNVAKKS
jgi:Holliday junction DNA helicase RuvA